MEIAVVIEPHDGGYRARCRHPVAAEASGHSRFDARSALEAVLQAHVAGPFTTLPLEVTPQQPWIASAGSVPDDAITEEWLDAVAEYRRQRDVADQQSLPPAQPVP
ncbi:unnamed protein product [Gemmataceae bacterium]|nr:unnamed protein product [Gemmataceae bacterium]VTT97406.1 unnamed protein product [Gemmataceae bacterium]